MGKRVLDLPSVTTLLGTDVLYAVRPTEALISNYDKKITWADLLAQINTASGYIATNGTSTTTATIPFAQGASFGGATTFNDVATFNYATQQTLGFQINPPVGSPDYITSAGTGYLEIWAVGKDLDLHTDDDLIYRATNYHKWDGGIGGSTAKYQFNGSAHIASTLRIGSIPTGTQVGLVGYDANGNLIQGTGGGGGSYVTLSGHNDLTTPWSIGDASTWATSSAGIQIDPVGSYGLHLKGNTIIEQAVSQALSLYRPVASGDVCLNFDAWDSLGAQSSYAQVCGVVVSNTAGAVGGGLDLEVAISGVLTPLLQLRQAGSTLVGPLSVTGAATLSHASFAELYFGPSSNAAFSLDVANGALRTYVGGTIRTSLTNALYTLNVPLSGTSATFTGSSGVLTNYLHLNNSDPSATLQEMQIYTRGNASGAYYGWNTQGNGAGGVTDLVLRYAGADVLRFVGDLGTFTGRVVTSASTATRAGLNLPHGTAPSSPVNGDLWTTTTGLFARINGATEQYAKLASPTFTGTVNSAAITSTGVITGRSFALTAQTNTPTGTTYTWTLTSGNQLDITLTSSTGDVTITTASPTAGAYSFLSTTGHGTLARNLTVTQSGVTFIMTGKTSGNTITLDSIPATKRALYCFYWITTTKCFIDRVTLEA